MKKLFTFLATVTLSVMLFAQAPQSFSYQTVIRDANWTVLDNQLVGIKVSIIEDAANGNVVYEETHSATTSQIGLVNLSVGEGTVISGVFNTIDWGNHNFFIEIAVDVSGGTSYIVMGTTQLRSVPYALYAETSGTPGTPGPIGLTGPAGANGIDGIDGNDGAVGATGPQGIQGLAGQDGVDGNDGAVGPQGPIGLTGPAGANGIDGVDGNDGAVGATGPQGIQGVPGQDGVDGNDGADGTNGTNGLPGTDGTNGTNGVDGADGMDVLGTSDQTLYHNGTDWVATSNLSNDGINATTDADMSINGMTVGKGGGNMSKNTALGSYALEDNTTGDFNTASGRRALFSNTTGEKNTASGVSALLYNTTGDDNTGLGISALKHNTEGDGNTASGVLALENNTTGDFNTASGRSALGLNTTGSNNTAIGYDAQTPSTTGSNQVRIGNTSITYAGVQVPWTITSDKHWKSDIQNSSLGLNLISKLRPVSYYRNNDENKKTEYGFIAQELEEALNTAGASNNGIISKDDEGMYGVRYNDLISPMVKAIQEQQEMITNQQELIKKLEVRITQLENK